MIRVENVSKSFGKGPNRVVALDGVSFGVRRGEIMGVIGLSGAGKSTLVRCMNLLERPDAGSIRLDGQDLSSLSSRELREARRQIGMVFQNFNLLNSATAGANVAFPLSLASWSAARIRPRVKELLELVELTDKENAYPGQLSGGQKQRVGIARALAGNPKVLLCDEPTSALDPMTTRSILGLLAAINRRLGLTIVLITHEMAVVKEICDRVVVLENGRVAEEGTVLELYARPRSRTGIDFLAAPWEANLPAEVLALQASFPSEGSGRVLAGLTFVGQAAYEPVVAQLAAGCGVTPNILYGGLDRVKDALVGRLLVELTGDSGALNKALAFLHARGVEVEVLSNHASAAD